MHAVQIVLLVSLLPLLTALDCRKFSFAPACRGIMLKRSQTSAEHLPEVVPPEIQVIAWLMVEAEAEGIRDCLPIEWIKSKIAPVQKRTFSSFA